MLSANFSFSGLIGYVSIYIFSPFLIYHFLPLYKSNFFDCVMDIEWLYFSLSKQIWQCIYGLTLVVFISKGWLEILAVVG